MEQNWLDIQHRGYRAYRQETEDLPACQRLRRKVTSVPGAPDKMDTVLYDCQIDPIWIEKIEEGLPFIDNAIKESRQFILRQGDVVPVEKVKRVSRASVEHLSRHSDLITRLPEPNESPIPDKLYMAENVGTYAVYENRFLYMLLRSLQDFLAYRYHKIKQTVESFSARLDMCREAIDGSHTIRYHLSFEESDQTPEDLVDPQTRKTITRIATILQEVDRLLKTPLMLEVADAPLLRPPVTRTNVLLHNPNFVAAFGLYSFLIEYESDGFRSVPRQQENKDADAMIKEDLASLISLTSYLSHRWGGLQETLEERFAAQQQMRLAQAEAEQKARLAQLKARCGESAEAALAYMLELERRNEDLETYSEQIRASQALQQETQAQLELALEAQEGLQQKIRLLETSLWEKEQALRQADDLKVQLHSTIEKQQQEENAHIEALRREYDTQLQQQKELFLKEYEALAESLRLENARQHARSGSDADLSSPEAFAELEAEYAAFRRFYQQQWKAAKRRIRRKHLDTND